MGFLPKIKPKGPQGPNGTPQDDKNCFLSCQDMKTPHLKKRIFGLSRIEKSWIIDTAEIDMVVKKIKGRRHCVRNIQFL